MRTKIQEFLIELNDKSEALFAEGFDDAIVGVQADSEIVIYDKSKMIQVLVNEGMNDLEAIEYLEYNVWGAYVGVHTPIYIDILSDVI